MSRMLIWLAIALCAAVTFTAAQTETGRHVLRLIATGEVQP